MAKSKKNCWGGLLGENPSLYTQINSNFLSTSGRA